MDGHKKLTIALEGIDVLLLKYDADPHELQLTNIFDALCRISGKPGDGLGDDVVDLTPPAIPDHSLELITFICSGAGNALVSRCQVRTKYF